MKTPGLLSPVCLFIFFITSQILMGQSVDKVNASLLQAHVYELASQEKEGRMSGTPGQKEAAAYIADAFMQAGLIPAGDSGFFQPFSLFHSTQEELHISGKKGSAILWSHCSAGMSFPDSARLVYTGNSKKGVKLTGAGTRFILLRYSGVKKLKPLLKHYADQGETRFLLITEGMQQQFQMMKVKNKDASYRLKSEPQQNLLDALTEGLTTYAIGFISAGTFMKVTGYSTENLNDMDRMMKKSKEATLLEGGFKLTIVPSIKSEVRTENVLGMLEGTGSKDEFIVITAHYDHVGKEKNKICPGADDNASGTAALLELARILSSEAQSGNKPAKSILFVAFTAEELGLFGSEFYVNSKENSKMKPVLNVNMDMIGKSIQYSMMETFRLQAQGFVEDTTRKESYVYLMNLGKGSRKGVKLSKEAAKRHPGFRIDRSPGFLIRLTYKVSSDHKNFRNKGIPALVYFTGLHPDYHKPGDTPEKLDYQNMARVTDVILQTVAALSGMQRKDAKP